VLTGPDEIAEVVFAGGAGFGDPHQCPAERVAADVRDGRIRATAAREIYGVKLAASALADAPIGAQ
jgi:N-methylhydantoinase B